MTPEIQQVVALGIVALVVALVVGRRWKHRKDNRPGCDGCAEKPDPTESGKDSEHTIHFFRKQD